MLLLGISIASISQSGSTRMRYNFNSDWKVSTGDLANAGHTDFLFSALVKKIL